MTTISADVGKSATRARVRSGDHVVEGLGPGLDPRDAVAADLGDRLVRVIAQSIDAADTAPAGTVTSVAVGTTAYPEVDAARILPAFARRWPAAAVIAGEDGVTAHAGALGAPGIVVSAGTGTIVTALTADGGWSRVDGWGPVFGDRGSGYAIGLAALRHTYAVRDRIVPPGPLAERVGDAIGGAGMTTAQAWLATDQLWARVAGLAEIVCRVALTDPVARELVERAARDAARSAVAARPDPAGGSVCLTGRLALSAVYADAFAAEVVAGGLVPRPPRGTALDGAERLPALPVYHPRCVQLLPSGPR